MVEEGKSLERSGKNRKWMKEEEREQRNLHKQLHVDYFFQSWKVFLVISQVEMISYIAQ